MSTDPPDSVIYLSECFTRVIRKCRVNTAAKGKLLTFHWSRSICHLSLKIGVFSAFPCQFRFLRGLHLCFVRVRYETIICQANSDIKRQLKSSLHQNQEPITERTSNPFRNGFSANWFTYFFSSRIGAERTKRGNKQHQGKEVNLLQHLPAVLNSFSALVIGLEWRGIVVSGGGRCAKNRTLQLSSPRPLQRKRRGTERDRMLD